MTIEQALQAARERVKRLQATAHAFNEPCLRCEAEAEVDRLVAAMREEGA